MRNVVRILPLCVLLLLYGCRKPSDRTSRGRARTKTESSNRRTAKKESSDRQGQVKPSIKQEPSKTKLDGAEIFERYGSAVFMVFTSDGFHGFQGSGFFIDDDGLAVSNYHVFQGTTIGMEQIKLPDSNTAYNVKEVIHKSSDEDFILFRVNCNNTSYIPIAASRPKIGERVYAIGSPQGLENTFSSGEISQWRDKNLIQTSVSIDHGSSGGALINEYGEVVGITSGTFDASSSANLNYAWSIEAVKPYLK